MAGIRIPLSWLICIAMLGVVVFFSYYILKAASTKEGFDNVINAMDVAQSAQAAYQLPAMAPANQLGGPQGKPLQTQPNQPSSRANGPLNMPAEFYQHADSDQKARGSVGLSQPNEPLLETTEQPAPALDRLQKPPVARPWPKIPAMTEDELRTPEPLQRTPPPVLYDDPEATDPLNRVAYMDAEFGSNLRHPEQMIERRAQAPGMGRVVASGIGSEVSSPGIHNADGYSPEMTQNGGHFMSSRTNGPNVLAWDGSTLNQAYSMI